MNTKLVEAMTIADTPPSKIQPVISTQRSFIWKKTGFDALAPRDGRRSSCQFFLRRLPKFRSPFFLRLLIEGI